jgi:hypothetical protein
MATASMFSGSAVNSDGNIILNASRDSGGARNYVFHDVNNQTAANAISSTPFAGFASALAYSNGSVWASALGGSLVKLKGTSKNRRDSSDAAKLPPNDSASFPFRFIDVHAGAARDRYREQFFEVPLKMFSGAHIDGEARTSGAPAACQKSDFAPRPDDIWQERLYAVQWITKDMVSVQPPLVQALASAPQPLVGQA